MQFVEGILLKIALKLNRLAISVVSMEQALTKAAKKKDYKTEAKEKH